MIKYFLILILSSATFLYSEEDNQYKIGYYDGKHDAVGKEEWFFGGLLTGPLGVGASFLLKTTYSPKSIDDYQSEEYLEGYIKGYEEETTLKNVRLASTGFLTLISIVFILNYF